MIVQCFNCLGRFNNDTVDSCPLCAYKKPLKRQRVAVEQDIENQVKGEFVRARRPSKYVQKN